MSEKLAVIFPGIGYHKDKPLLYYGAKLLMEKGFEVFSVSFHDMPGKIMGDKDMIRKAAEIAFLQAKEQLSDIDFLNYKEIVFVGKSIGTVALAKYVHDFDIKASQIWYTPLEDTFSFMSKDVISFIGDEDPWSDVAKVKEIASEQKIPLFSYPKCNHSLETSRIQENIVVLQDVMNKTEKFVEENVR